ncbi:HYR domain-containing protein, partial [Aequorivita viscosa]|nr:HYR domain-containing protein [Aequorivita viscosa]
DVNGNVSTCTSTVTVTDPLSACNQFPVAVCQPVTVNADGSCQGNAVASDFDGGSTDPNGDPLTFSVSPAGPYLLGITNVTLTVSDGTNSSTCTTTIEVVDNTPPAIVCPTNIIKSNDPGICGAVITYTIPVGTDNCSVASTIQTAGL